MPFVSQTGDFGGNPIGTTVLLQPGLKDFWGQRLLPKSLQNQINQLVDEINKFQPEKELKEELKNLEQECDFLKQQCRWSV